MDITTNLLQRIEETQKDIAEALVSGNAGDFNKYQRLVGRADGLKIAKQIINDILSELEEKDRYDE
jgi:hypothetical protein